MSGTREQAELSDTPATGPSSADWAGSDVPWDELVAASLLGAERRTLPGGSVEAMLDLAAVHTVQRRAGLSPAKARPRPDPAPTDPRRVLPPAAVRRLDRLLARSKRSGGGYRTRSSDPESGLGELLAEWLTLANERGYGAPYGLLPALLDAAKARTDLRPQALAFAGPRATWLARLNPEWKFALRAAGGQSTYGATPYEDGTAAGAESPQDAEGVQLLWEEGLFAERVALLTAVRRRDAAAGRELLSSTWSTERAEDRLMFLDSLREGLSLDDELLLEKALSDRSKNVRATAAELLCMLPQSALAARMSARARACVSLDHTSGAAAPQLVVEPPHECDAAMVKDGVVREPPKGRGQRSWWLVQTVEAAPLSDWSAHLGGRPPAELLALPVTDDWRTDLHTAWAWAAVRQHDVAWATALLGSPSAPTSDTPGDPARLLAVLPEEQRAAWAADFVATHGLADGFRVLSSCAVPWPARLGQVVVDAMEIAREAGSYPWSFSGVLGLAERCLEPEQATRLMPLAARAAEPEDGAPGAGDYWSNAFGRLVQTLQIRAEMSAELPE